MDEHVVVLKGATKIYKKSSLGRTTGTIGVSDLDLKIRKGEVYGLLGLNGSGKTTTIKMMLGLHYPTRGTVCVLGEPMPDRDVLRKIGFLPELAYLNEHLTGRETLTTLARFSQVPRARCRETVEEVLAAVGMTQAADKRLSEYSKGMRQRISIAQALAHDPEILVLDEPITGLDPLAITEIRSLIQELKERGKTVFFSSHSISEVEKVCDRIGILSGGRLLKVASHDEWSAREGRLEELFTSTVERTESIGRLRLTKRSS